MFGIINVYKEKDMTSFDVIAKLRKILNEKKIGHTGTLDPMATGVLPICIGHATKLVPYIINEDKQYFVTLKLGIKTDTLDITGKILKQEEPPKFTVNEIKECLNSFIGKHEQIPPMYSAKKQNGKKLYQLARLGIEVERKPSNIEIYDITDIKYVKKDNEISFVVDCSKGTYIRVLCEEIAEKLQTIGTMIGLERTKTGIFTKNDSYTIYEVEEMKNNGKIDDIFYNVETLFNSYGQVVISDSDMEKFLNGVKLDTNLEDGIYKLYNEQKQFIGLGNIKDKYIKRDFII